MKLFNQNGTCFECKSLGKVQPKLSGKDGISYQSCLLINNKPVQAWEKNGSECLISCIGGTWYRIPGFAPAKGRPGKYEGCAHGHLYTKDPTSTKVTKLKLYNGFGNCFECQCVGSTKPQGLVQAFNRMANIKIDLEVRYAWLLSTGNAYAFQHNDLWYLLPKPTIIQQMNAMTQPIILFTQNPRK